MKKIFFVLPGLFLLAFTAAKGQDQVGSIGIAVNSNTFELPLLSREAVRNGNPLVVSVFQNPPYNLKGKYFLSMEIQGGNMRIEHVPGFRNIIIDFEKTKQKILFSSDLASYFDLDNLVFYGYSKEDYLNSGLPKGGYKICFKLHSVGMPDNSFMPPVKTSCVSYWVNPQQAPTLLTPADGSTLKSRRKGTITWHGNHTSLNPVKYTVYIFEDQPGVSARDVFLTQTPVVEYTSYTERVDDPSVYTNLRSGRSYLMYVGVASVFNDIKFMNNGLSNPHRFTFSGVPQRSANATGQNCKLPAAAAFINEVSNGTGNTEEYVEIVVAGTDSDGELVNLSGFIIDDNNYNGANVGNETGHIALGDCVSSVRRGSIILLYDDESLSFSDLDPSVILLPFSSDCVIKNSACPDFHQNNTGYDCSGTLGKEERWQTLIPMKNRGDVIQLRRPSGELEHAITWTGSYEFADSPKALSLSGNTSFVSGKTWLDKDNYASVAGTPGMANSVENADLINALGAQGAGNSFTINCSVQQTPQSAIVTITIDNALGGSLYQLFVDGQPDQTTPLSSIQLTGLEDGYHSFLVVDTISGCQDQCDIVIEHTCITGLPCDDFNPCTINDVIDTSCNCVGTPDLEVEFILDTVYVETCDYCFDLSQDLLELPGQNKWLDIWSVKMKDRIGNEIIVDNTYGYPFSFPYRFELNADSTYQINSFFFDHFAAWFSEQGVSGTTGYTTDDDAHGGCFVSGKNMYINNSALEFVSFEGQTSIGDYRAFLFEEGGCQVFDKVLGTELIVHTACSPNTQVQWSDGSTEASVVISPGTTACYAVSVTCYNPFDGIESCTATAIWGEGCDDSGGCIYGAPCLPDSTHNCECVLEATYDENCNCVVVCGIDTDGDGSCDEVDPCGTYTLALNVRQNDYLLCNDTLDYSAICQFDAGVVNSMVIQGVLNGQLLEKVYTGAWPTATIGQQMDTYVEDFISSYSASGTVSYMANTGLPCQETNGVYQVFSGNNQLFITQSNIDFVSVALYADSSDFMAFGFSSTDCNGYAPGTTVYNLMADLEGCPNPNFIWNTGDAGSNIEVVQQLADQAVEVTAYCLDSCSYVISTILTGSFSCDVVGDSCEVQCVSDTSVYLPGFYDENCECQLDLNNSMAIIDTDSDGVVDCLDPCVRVDNHEDLNGDGIPDCAQDLQECDCEDEPVIAYNVLEQVVYTNCNSWEPGNDQIGDVFVRYVHNGISYNQNLRGAFPFDFEFPYSTQLTGDHNARDLVSDIYHWALDRGIMLTAQVADSLGTSCGPHAHSVLFSNQDGKLSTIRFKVQHADTGLYTWVDHWAQGSDTLAVAYNDISVVIPDTCTTCQDGQVAYLWSDGSRSNMPYVDSIPVNQDYEVTVTCYSPDSLSVTADSCVFTLNMGNGGCLIGAPCYAVNTCPVSGNDGANPTPTGAIGVGENCPCEPLSDEVDTDGDGIPDACDACPDFDDQIDTDGDGVPNGCDECVGFDDALLYDTIPENDPIDCTACEILRTTIVYSSYVRISTTAGGGCPPGEFISGFSYNIPELGVTMQDISAYGFADAYFNFPYGSSPAAINQFAEDLQQFLTEAGFGGVVSLSSIGVLHYRLSVKKSRLEFETINVACTTNSGYPISHTFSFSESSKSIIQEPSGAPCDDGNECTVLDAWNEDCVCEGIYADTDGDGVCDAEDQCPGWPDYLGCENTAVACEGGSLDACDYFVNMLGIATPSYAATGSVVAIQHKASEVQCAILSYLDLGGWEISDQDTDGDGIYDVFDLCPGNPNVPANGYYNPQDVAQCCNVSPEGASLLKHYLVQVVNHITYANPIDDPCYQGANDEPGIGDDYACQFTQPQANIKPGCAIEMGISVYEDELCVLRRTDTDCVIEFRLDCYGDCIAFYPYGNDTTSCNSPDIPDFGCDPDSVSCPAIPCAYTYVDQDCNCITELYDADGDGICDYEDDCPDSDTDTDGDGIQDGCDDCDHIAGGPGDPCDDGDPCTFADEIRMVGDSCFCLGLIVDADNDGVAECDSCQVAFDNDGDGYIDEIVAQTSTGINSQGEVVTVQTCDVCPGLDDLADYNNNGIPDCLDPPYYEIGCPESLTTVPGEGIVLTFSSLNITADQLPEPISFTYSLNTNTDSNLVSAISVYNEDYLLIGYVREANGVFEVFYPLDSIYYDIDEYGYTAISYADHQPCIFQGGENPAQLNCPDSVYAGINQLALDFTVPDGYSFDVASITGAIDVSGLSGPGGGFPESTYPLGNNIELNNTDLTDLTIRVNVPDLPSGLNPLSGVLILPSGTSCPISDGGTVPIPGCDGAVGDPCDDGNPHTHHDRLDENCNCEGEDKPDTDGDGISDEFDQCINIMNDSTGMCPCPDLILHAPDTLVNGNDYEFYIDPMLLDSFSHLSITVTGGPEPMSLDGVPFSNPVRVPNLDYGYSYTIEVTGTCVGGGTSVAAPIEMDVDFSEDQFVCGVNFEEVDIYSQLMLAALNKGETFNAADFVVHVRKVSGSYGTFSGKGYIEVPYFNRARLNVSWEDITINSDRNMIVGCIVLDGFGLAILGDPLSDMINEGLNNIMNVLTEINEVLDEVIEVLDAIEELVETTGDLVDPTIVECIETQTAILEQLAAQEPADQAAIQAATETLQDCMDQYNQQLAAILDNMLAFTELTLQNYIPGYCDSNGDFVQPFSEVEGQPLIEFQNSLDTLLSHINQGGSGIAGMTSILDTTITTQGDISQIDPVLVATMEDYYEREGNHDLCILIREMDEYLSNNELQLEQVKNLLLVFMNVNIDLADEIGPMLTVEEPDYQEVYNTHAATIHRAYILAIRSLVY